MTDECQDSVSYQHLVSFHEHLHLEFEPVGQVFGDDDDGADNDDNGDVGDDGDHGDHGDDEEEHLHLKLEPVRQAGCCGSVVHCPRVLNIFKY